MGGRVTKQEYLTCPICAAQTKDYFISTSGSLITDVKCTNRKCFFSSNYVPINVWDRYMHMVERCYSLEAENTNLKTEIAQLKKDKLEFNAQCFHKDETISVLENRITELESANRSLVEQVNQMVMRMEHKSGTAQRRQG